MKNSVMYLTRRCPYNCDYCGIVDNTRKKSDELSLEEWQRAFKILEELGVEFNLVLGNEPWLLGEDLPKIITSSDIPSAVYTTCHKPLWDRHRDKVFMEYGMDNLSIGVDVPRSERVKGVDDSLRKGWNAWDAFDWIKENAPFVDCHATVTLHRGNYKTVPKVISQLDEMGVFSNINFIHWNKDGKYDFFGETRFLEHLLFKPEDYGALGDTINQVLEDQKMLQNPEMLEQPVEDLVNMGWHCNGNPYGGPTVDSDGTLRVCGYRQGERTSKFSIFDLPEKEEEWRQAVYDDAMDCPGCQWSCSWMWNYWNEKAPDKGTEIFTKHKVFV